MAKVFVTLRLTGHVSNGVARDLLAQLQACTDAFQAEGVEVKQSVDSRWDPEAAEVPVVAPEVALVEAWTGLDLSAGPDATGVVEVEPSESPKKSKFKGAR